MTAESGLDHLPGVEDNFKSSTYNHEVNFVVVFSHVTDQE